MRHLGAFPTNQGLRIAWLRDDVTHAQLSAGEEPVFEMEFSRLVIGLSFEKPLYGAVVAERVLRTRRGASRYFVVIDEIEEVLASEVFDWCIEMKDRYRIQTIYCPKTPVQLVESLRQTEGLTWYSDDITNTEASRRWPHFIDVEMRCGVHQTETPQEAAVHRDLEEWINEEVPDPNTKLPITGGDGQPINLIQTPENFNTSHARAAIRRATYTHCLGLWMAVHHLHRSRQYLQDDSEPEFSRRSSSPTGY